MKFTVNTTVRDDDGMDQKYFVENPDTNGVEEFPLRFLNGYLHREEDTVSVLLGTVYSGIDPFVKGIINPEQLDPIEQYDWKFVDLMKIDDETVGVFYRWVDCVDNDGDSHHIRETKLLSVDKGNLFGRIFEIDLLSE